MKRVVLIALILRLTVAAALLTAGGPRMAMSPDSASYLESARSLKKSGQFQREGHPEVIRTPGYPLFLIPGLAAGRVVEVTVGLQILLDGATAAMIFALVRSLGGGRSGATVAGLLFALDPVAFVWPAKILTKTLFTFLTALFLLLAVLGWTRKRPALSVASFAVLAAAYFVRPIGVAFAAALFGALLLFTLLGVMDRKRGALLCGLLVLCTGIPLGLWSFRNERVTGYHGFSGISAVNMYFYNGASVQATLEGLPFDEENFRKRPILWEGEVTTPAQLPVWKGTVLNELRRRGSAVLREHPLLYSRIHLEGSLRTAFEGLKFARFRSVGVLGAFIGQRSEGDPQKDGAPSSAMSTRKGLFALVAAVAGHQFVIAACTLFSAALLASGYLLASAAILSGVPREPLRIPVLLLAGTVLTFILVSGGPVGGPRFRLPALPALYALAGLGAGILLTERGKKESVGQ